MGGTVKVPSEAGMLSTACDSHLACTQHQQSSQSAWLARPDPTQPSHPTTRTWLQPAAGCEHAGSAMSVGVGQASWYWEAGTGFFIQRRTCGGGAGGAEWGQLYAVMAGWQQVSEPASPASIGTVRRGRRMIARCEDSP